MRRALWAAVSRLPGWRRATFSLRLAIAASSLLASMATAQDFSPRGAGIGTADDAPLLTHLPYGTASRAELTRPPRALRGQCEAVNRDLLAALAALLARADDDPEVGRSILALSCFRSPAHQAQLFRRAARTRAALPQAYQVAPPGHSEHATGLAIDFGDRRHGCNLVGCFAETPVGRWLAAHAAEFGFEMSFPQGNAQGVAFEPWHWRWVGRDGDDRSLRARNIFAAAREHFPIAGSAVPIRVDLADSTQLAPSLAASPLVAPRTASAAAPSKLQAGQ